MVMRIATVGALLAMVVLGSVVGRRRAAARPQADDAGELRNANGVEAWDTGTLAPAQRWRSGTGAEPPPDEESWKAALRAMRVFAIGGVLSAVVFGLIGLAVIAAFFFAREELALTFRQTWTIVAVFFLTSFGALLLGLGIYAMVSRRFGEEAARERARRAVDDLPPVGTTLLPALIKANRMQLEAYDVLVRGQAASAFRNSQIVMGLGFVVLVGGVVFAIVSTDTTATLIASTLSALGGILAAYISRTFLHVYRETITELNRYFEQPLLGSYILAAERMARENLDDSARERLVTELVRHVIADLIEPRARDGPVGFQNLFTPRDHPDLQAEPSADAPHG